MHNAVCFIDQGGRRNIQFIKNKLTNKIFRRSIFAQTQHNHDNHHYYYQMKTNVTQISF